MVDFGENKLNHVPSVSGPRPSSHFLTIIVTKTDKNVEGRQEWIFPVAGRSLVLIYPPPLAILLRQWVKYCMLQKYSTGGGLLDMLVA